MSSLLSLAILETSALAAAPPQPADPFADPANDPYNILKYIASNTLTSIAFVFILLVPLAHTYLLRRYGGRFMLAMVIAEYIFTIGIACRWGLHANPESKGLYIVENTLVVLSPVRFIAADYVLLGRMARWLKCNSHLLIRPQRITLIFILSDVFIFLIQGIGGGMSAMTNPDSVTLGAHIFLAGLILQLISFALYTLLFLRFLYRVYTLEPQVWQRDALKPWYRDWRGLAAALSISCIGILTRSAYRCIELSEGYSGHLSTVEGFFYALDTIPLFLAILVYVHFWPGRFIPNVEELKRMEFHDRNDSEMGRIRMLDHEERGSDLQLRGEGRRSK